MALERLSFGSRSIFFWMIISQLKKSFSMHSPEISWCNSFFFSPCFLKITPALFNCFFSTHFLQLAMLWEFLSAVFFLLFSISYSFPGFPKRFFSILFLFFASISFSSTGLHNTAKWKLTPQKLEEDKKKIWAIIS